MGGQVGEGIIEKFLAKLTLSLGSASQNLGISPLSSLMWAQNGTDKVMRATPFLVSQGKTTQTSVSTAQVIVDMLLASNGATAGSHETPQPRTQK